ncbi:MULTISPECIES: methyltetrahydrofolate cobalamin methyltransferase [Sporomusa]|jgi:cobalamin-dependent methionine synthase I|uniref:methyltetrahydrofolate cobalamin methyltransferase n=1 Tax=Sporomusa TaxID=2375 RepID=UPI001CB7C2A9|nr:MULTISPECIES: methyltetrahydrofolate cobalamin methyltransferase [Sporomusa]MCM0758161.1 methyltetrahydrofolate cobalamin methyltransferase [Sporomusa sphaeroides DSM 2875]HML32828.1 methyltetrahydrofolate cobalamin methyltransferase [Sporomusa sphaeroides]
MALVIVGELINTSRKAISEAVDNKNAQVIQQVALEQVEAGATYIDVNCGNKVFDEVENMRWLVNTVQEAVKVPLCIDSPNPLALAAGLELVKYGTPMINSITDESSRFEAIIPLVQKYKAKIVALCMDDTGMPDTAADRIRVVKSLHAKLTAAGVKDDDIYFDPLVKPVSSVGTAGVEVLETIKLIKEQYPQVHFMCGLSNVSYGLPNRKYLNSLFVALTMAVGMDGYILNPTDKSMMGLIYAAKTLLGQDEYCMGYIKAHRKGFY